MTGWALFVALVGLAVLVGLSVAIGASLDTEAQRSVYRDMAAERRRRQTELERLERLREELRQQQLPVTGRRSPDQLCGECPYRARGNFEIGSPE